MCAKRIRVFAYDPFGLLRQSATECPVPVNPTSPVEMNPKKLGIVRGFDGWGIGEIDHRIEVLCNSISIIHIILYKQLARLC